ncbi:hypothetical protein BH11BAC1_BH11BAC1_09170 [soil metagenome]
MDKSKIVNSVVKVEGGFLIVTKDGKTYQFELKKLSERLAKASNQQLKQFTISASGYGIHWHAIDEDIPIPALLNEQVPSYGKKSSKG